MKDRHHCHTAKLSINYLDFNGSMRAVITPLLCISDLRPSSRAMLVKTTAEFAMANSLVSDSRSINGSTPLSLNNLLK